jgi:hypothetical protein
MVKQCSEYGKKETAAVDLTMIDEKYLCDDCLMK